MTEILPDGKYMACECGALPDGRNLSDGMGRITFMWGRLPPWAFDIYEGTHVHKYREVFRVSA